MGRKVRGTIHWVSCEHCVDAEIHLYDKLFTEANMKRHFPMALTSRIT